MMRLANVPLIFLIFLTGCMGDCGSNSPNPTPTPQATPTPSLPETPTPLPPATLKPMVDGVAWFKVSGLDSLNLSLKPDFRDLDVIATLPWETSKELHLQAPGIELSIRGTSKEPCAVANSCGNKAGLIVSVTHNIMYDRKVYNENKDKPEEEVEELYAGMKLALNQRLAIGQPSSGDDSFLLKVDLSSGLKRALFETYQGNRKIQSWEYNYRFGCPLGIGQLVQGAPYSINQRRLWWYKAFSAHGRVKVELIKQELRGDSQELVYPCPKF